MDGDSGIGSPDAEYAADQANPEQSQGSSSSYQQQDYRAQPGRKMNTDMSIHAMLSPSPSYSG
jgi:hypothetical protein